MRCPRGSPRVTSIPLRTMNGLRTRTLESGAGTSTCQPVRSLPLNRLRGGASGVRRELAPRAVATQNARNRNDFMRTPSRWAKLLLVEFNDHRRILIEIAVANPRRSHSHIHYARPDLARGAVGPHREVGRLDSSQLIVPRLVGDAFVLHSTFVAVYPATYHECEPRIAAEIHALASRLDRVEYQFKRVRHADSDQSRLCPAARCNRRLDGKALRTHELEQFCRSHEVAARARCLRARS